MTPLHQRNPYEFPYRIRKIIYNPNCIVAGREFIILPLQWETITLPFFGWVSNFSRSWLGVISAENDAIGLAGLERRKDSSLKDSNDL